MKKKRKKQLIGNGLGTFGKKVFWESIKEYYRAKEKMKNE